MPIVRAGRTSLVVMVCFAALVGCSKGDLAPLSGKIKVDGLPVSSGRLMLIPMSSGERADSLVAEDGAFLARTKGVPGAKPGAYRVTFAAPMTEPKNAKDRIGDLPPSQISVVYQSPADAPLVIAESGANDLEINVEIKQGWTRTVTD